MEPNLPSSIDLTRLPPEAAKSLLSHYEQLQKQYAKPRLSAEERLREFDAWVASHADVKGVADDSRDSIYD